MKVPVTWLQEYCDPGLPAEEIAELLSMRAVEVERVSTAGPPSADGFVVGRVLAAEPHPNADRLRVCTVDSGDGERTIVCGAPNVAAGQTVAVALPGAAMPGGQQLGKATLRGVESAGMILAADELGLGPDHEGIMVLDDEIRPALPPSAATPRGRSVPNRDATSPRPSAGASASRPAGLLPGTPLTDLYPVTEQVLELDLNPNRGDCLGVYGVAREVHAITGAPLAPPPWEQDAEATGEGSVEHLASVRVDVPELCPRFTARAFSGVEIGPSPLWLRARLAAAGQRPISNVVDVTNYVMLLTAQPLHAFDLDRVPGGEIVVRRAADRETMTTLDGAERRFDTETVLVCDRDRPSGIAGIMGGQVSEVSAATTRVLLEAATWNGDNILRTSHALGLRSEASARFEKQLHPELAMRGQRVASRLFAELAGAALVPGTIDAATEPPPAHVISLSGVRAERLLGAPIPRDEALEHLDRLGFAPEPVGDHDLRATITPERHFDVAREVDLIEEVARLHGLDRLPRTLPSHGERRGGLDREQRLLRRIDDAMAALGFDQAITQSQVAPEMAERLRLPEGDPRRDPIRISNPLSEESSVMRTMLLGGLLGAARHNLARGAGSVSLFESGRVFLAREPATGGGPAAGAFAGSRPAPGAEPHHLGALLVGCLAPVGWWAPPSTGDFYELKGVAESLSERLACELAFEPRTEPFLHPGRAATVSVGGAEAGWIGELHPALTLALDFPGGVAFELATAPLLAASPEDVVFEDVTTHPALLHDLAVAVPDDVPAEAVRATVAAAGGELLRSVTVFDLYRGEQVGEGRKSLALTLSFRAPGRTLTDAEVAPLRELIRAALAAIGGEFRE